MRGFELGVGLLGVVSFIGSAAAEPPELLYKDACGWARSGYGPASSAVLLHDAQGRLVEEIIDQDGDGVDDRHIFYRWNTAGGLTFVGTDDDPLGAGVDRSETYVYDAAGNLIREEDDVDGDGVPDQLYRHVIFGGRRYTTEIDIGADGMKDYQTDYFYWADLRIGQEGYDTDLDGDYEQRITHRWFQDGVVEQQLWDLDGDNDADSIETRYRFPYPDGRPSSIDYDYDADFNVDTRVLFNWDGTRLVSRVVDDAGTAFDYSIVYGACD